MPVRIARKILINGRPSDPSNPGRMSRYERRARKIVLRRWARYAWDDGVFSEAGEVRSHANHRAPPASARRWLGVKL